MNAKQIAKWETFKTKTAELNHMINLAGYMGLAVVLQDYQRQYNEAHAQMKAFAKRHNLMNEYEAWIS